MNIRPFRYTDIDALIEIAKVSFAEEYTSRGITSDEFIRQVRMTTRGRMIPFKLLTALAGIQWQLLVAEVDGKVVGCGAYLGRKKMELTNLMVHPDYRRRGIGQALLVKRLHCLTTEKYPHVTTTILASNRASLGNVAKQGFEIFDRYTLYEIPLPPQHENNGKTNQLTSRPVSKDDAAAFHAIEQRVTNPVRLEIYGSAFSTYNPTLGDNLMNRLSQAQQWSRLFSKDGNIIGFLSANTSNSQTKGILNRPVVTDENLCYFPELIQEAMTWLSQKGKTALQVTIADERQEAVEKLQSIGGVKIHSWVQLIKYLGE